ncbi:MAG: hypothetical protein IKC59_01350 [Clostridia bacterium]|nr:hypothetical protein [Clostridia bacterium]
MPHLNRRLHRRGRKLSPLAIVGICLGAAVLIALIVGNILNAWLDDETVEALKGTQPEQSEPPTPDLPTRTVPSVRSYPFALGDDVRKLTSDAETQLNSVTVSLNTSDGKVTYRSNVADYLGLTSLTDASLRDEMSKLTSEIPYVCGAFYLPALSDADNADLLYAMAASDAALMREFIHAGGSEILLLGGSFDSDTLPYLSDYITLLKAALGNTPVVLSVPLEIAMGTDQWQLLPSLRPLADLLAVDLREISDTDMEQALLDSNYYVSAYDMRLVMSESQTGWISAVEEIYSDYQIVSATE